MSLLARTLTTEMLRDLVARDAEKPGGEPQLILGAGGVDLFDHHHENVRRDVFGEVDIGDAGEGEAIDHREKAPIEQAHRDMIQPARSLEHERERLCRGPCHTSAGTSIASRAVPASLTVHLTHCPVPHMVERHSVTEKRPGTWLVLVIALTVDLSRQ